jgi:hypothetical protein
MIWMNGYNRVNRHKLDDVLLFNISIDQICLKHFKIIRLLIHPPWHAWLDYVNKYVIWCTYV